MAIQYCLRGVKACYFKKSLSEIGSDWYNTNINLEFAVNMKKTVQTQDRTCLHSPSSP